MGIIVQKFGGSSVANAERMAACAQRIAEAVGAGASVAVVVSAMGSATDRLIASAGEIAGPGRASAREMDQLLATGEQVSIALFAMALERIGLKAVSLTGQQAGIHTDGVFGRARITRIDTERLRAELEAGRVPVVAGFQGVGPTGELTTLGRGGSDTTAVALAAALGAEACEIGTDVDGVYSADPRIVPDATRWPTISYDEMLEAAALGAKVMHPRAVETARRHAVPVKVLHSHRPGGGTMIVELADSTRPVAAVVHKTRVARIAIHGVRNAPGVQAALLRPLAAAHVPVDDIIQTEPTGGIADMVVTVSESDLAEAGPLLAEGARSLGAPAPVIQTGYSKVSAVGAGMRTATGVAAKMFEAIGGANVRAVNVSTSEISISCLIDAESGEDATRAVHRAFGLGAGEGPRVVVMDRDAAAAGRTHPG